MDVVLIGAGGHGKVVLEVLRHSRGARPIGFLDADPTLTGTSVGGLEVLGPVQLLGKLRQQKVRGAIVSIGDNRIRRSYAAEVLASGLELISAVHPAASVASSAVLGKNVVVCAGAVVGPEAQIDESAIVNTAAVVDHECRVGPAAHVCPGALLAGRVRIGAEAFVGLGAKIIQCLHVGDGATIGAGAVVIRDVPAGAKVVGVPARAI